LPLNSMALRPYSLAFLLNEVIINGRKNIIEFGSGISTILLGRLLKINGIDATVKSIDQSKEWVALLNDLIHKEDLGKIVEVVYIPLEKRNEKEGSPHWYTKSIIDGLFKTASFDMVVVDGPTAFEKEIEWSRYFALPFIQQRLAHNYVILLDDANRGGEKKVLQAWAQEFQLSFTIFGDTFAVAYKGDYFESNPFKYASVSAAQ
jgi:predicted O-methyltransferase YrrM